MDPSLIFPVGHSIDLEVYPFVCFHFVAFFRWFPTWLKIEIAPMIQNVGIDLNKKDGCMEENNGFFVDDDEG